MNTKKVKKEPCQIYVGVKPGGKKEVFRCTGEPTEQSHGKTYSMCIGPFRTVRGATFATARFAHGTVAEMERAAKREAERKSPIPKTHLKGWITGKIRLLVKPDNQPTLLFQKDKKPVLVIVRNGNSYSLPLSMRVAEELASAGFSYGS